MYSNADSQVRRSLQTKACPHSTLNLLLYPQIDLDLMFAIDSKGFLWQKSRYHELIFDLLM